MTPRDPSSQLPLTPAVLHIMLALASGERHGYAIAGEVDETTSGSIRMGPGTLYGSIRRMLGAGLIEEVSPKRARDDDERRRYYRLTAFGRRVLELEVQRLDGVVRVAKRKHVLGDAGAL
jgi:DNA-binding PadR family transcriptional regulator